MRRHNQEKHSELPNKWTYSLPDFPNFVVHLRKKKNNIFQENIKRRYFFPQFSFPPQSSVAFWKEYIAYYSTFRSCQTPSPSTQLFQPISKSSRTPACVQCLLYISLQEEKKTSFKKISLTYTAQKNITANSNMLSALLETKQLQQQQQQATNPNPFSPFPFMSWEHNSVTEFKAVFSKWINHTQCQYEYSKKYQRSSLLT